jgi:hypothetical protein
VTGLERIRDSPSPIRASRVSTVGGVEERAQASVEYLLLLIVLLLGTCLLVRYETPVKAVATAVVHALVGRAGHPSPARGRRHPHRPPTRRRHTCVCPVVRRYTLGHRTVRLEMA